MKQEVFSKLFVGMEFFIDVDKHSKIDIQNEDNFCSLNIEPFEYGTDGTVGYKIKKISYVNENDVEQEIEGDE